MSLSIFIFNLPIRLNIEKVLEEEFSKYGGANKVRLEKKKTSGFVTFMELSSKEKIMKYNGEIVCI